MKKKLSMVTGVIALLASGCAPADVSGNYSVAVTNGPNHCEINGWETGVSNANIPIVITQEGDEVEVTVEGLAALALDLLIGSHRFEGTVGGNHIQADIVGTRTHREGNCVFTVRAELDADLDGDFLTGEIAYRPITNGHADCGVLDSCANVQSFNGTRPPSE